MWPLNQPPHTADATFAICITRVRDTSLRTRLKAGVPSIVAAEAAFATSSIAGTLDQAQSAAFQVSGVTSNEMVAVYDSRMAKKGAPGRPIYNDLRIAPANGRCPRCFHRTVSTLDHALPKNKFPALAVTPLNLVPSCQECNKVKLDTVPSLPEEVTLNPYFESVDDDTWLCAQVVGTSPAEVQFRPVAPAHWEPVLASRVDHHFKLFGLAALYAAQAVTELEGNRQLFTSVLKSAGPSGLQQHLIEQGASWRSVHRNSWQAAFYAALADSPTVCGGIF